MKRSILWAVAGAVALTSSTSAFAGSANMFSPAPAVLSAVENDSAYAALAKEPSAGAMRIVMADAAMVNLANDTLSLNLDFGGPLTITARRTGGQVNDDRSVLWSGVVAETASTGQRLATDIADDPMNSVMIIRNGDKLTGNIRILGQLYKLRPLHDSRHALVEVDEAAMPLDHPPSEYRKLFAAAQPEPKGAGTDAVAANTVIRALVNYTPSAASASGDINGLINLAVAETNQGYTNSGVTITLQLAAKSQISYTETGNFTTDLNRYRGTADGYMDAIHTQRNSTAADVAVLIVTNSAYCGLASGIGSTAATAFAEVYWDCATGYYSFGHEIGHLQSARHDPANDSSTTPYAYGHGYQYPAGGWRTIMAYACSGASCTRLNFWSNPGKTYNGKAMGTAAKHDNHRVLNNTRAAIAAFR